MNEERLREQVMWHRATEPAHTGQLTDHFAGSGTYNCAHCGSTLFAAASKFACPCGWPAFARAVDGGVELSPDAKDAAHAPGRPDRWRTEVKCAQCHGHLGHLFRQERHMIEGSARVLDRYCINSICLRFVP